MGAGGVHLVEAGQQAETVVLAEPVEILGALDGGGIAAGVVVSLMHPGLIDVGGPHKGGRVPLQHQHPLALLAALVRRIQAIQPRAQNDLIVCHGFAPPSA